jgi:hypothetical protein
MGKQGNRERPVKRGLRGGLGPQSREMGFSAQQHQELFFRYYFQKSAKGPMERKVYRQRGMIESKKQIDG